MKIPCTRITLKSSVPKAQTPGSAAVDLASAGVYIIRHHDVTYVPTQIRVAIPAGYFGMLSLRSGWAAKNHCVMPNGVGVIDSDYRGEIIVPVYSLQPHNFVLSSHVRFAQLTLIKCETVELDMITGDMFDEFYSTERNSGGFGSTGEV